MEINYWELKEQNFIFQKLWNRYLVMKYNINILAKLANKKKTKKKRERKNNVNKIGLI